MPKTASLALALCLAACLPAAPEDTCGAVARIGLVGQPVSAATDLPPGTRIIRPGTSVTDDYGESRLNLYLDDRDIITTLTCG